MKTEDEMRQDQVAINHFSDSTALQCKSCLRQTHRNGLVVLGCSRCKHLIQMENICIETDRQTDRSGVRHLFGTSMGTDTLPKAALEDGTAATRREMLKMTNTPKRHVLVETLNFIPLVMEHFGRWGQEAQEYLNELLSTATWTTECRWDEFKNYWRTLSSIVMQQCNARVLLQKMSRVQYSGDSVGAISNSVSLLSTV